MTLSYRIVTLDPLFDRSSFRCGSNALDEYFRDRVSQDVRRGVTTCFVLLSGEDSVVGFYTLAATGLLLSDLPGTTAKKVAALSSCAGGTDGKVSG